MLARIRAWWKRVNEVPPINVVNGREYPMPDDPRWQYNGTEAFIDELRVARWGDEFSGGWWYSIRCNNVTLAENSAGTYVDAVIDYQLTKRRRLAEAVADRIVREGK